MNIQNKIKQLDREIQQEIEFQKRLERQAFINLTDALNDCQNQAIDNYYHTGG